MIGSTTRARRRGRRAPDFGWGPASGKGVATMKSFKRVPIALLTSLLISMFAVATDIERVAADVPFATTPAPDVSPKVAFTHGDGSVTVTTNECPYYNNSPGSTVNGAITLADNGDQSIIKKVSGDWQVQPCHNHLVAGADGTSYVVRVGTFVSVSYPYQLVAARDNAMLWSRSFRDSCSNRYAQIHSLVMGPSNILYAHLHWPYLSPACGSKESLVAIDAATGATRFESQLPTQGNPSVTTTHVMPYEEGIAVLGGSTVHYFGYDGALLTSATAFAPALNGANITNVDVVPSTGRVYMGTSKYVSGCCTYQHHLYYKDPTATTIQEVMLPSGSGLGWFETTPANGVVVGLSFSGAPGFGYFGASGALVYQKLMNTEPNANVLSPYGIGAGSWLVDDAGNVITRRIVDYYTGTQDRHVLIDSFSPTGVATRLWSSTSLGSAGFDAYNSTGPLFESFAGGRLHVIVCHATSGYLATCGSPNNPVVLGLEMPGTADYSRAWVFAELSQQAEYVALGDSFSAGEGVPAFTPPSDTNGCHRSQQGSYPVILPQLVGSLRLSAFRACSGATTDQLRVGMSGEPGQLDALNENTDIVTLTAGGNDVDFSAFASQCFWGTCDADSSEYQATMDAIDNVLPGELADLYDDIADQAPNAQVYVLGYPYLAPEVIDDCPPPWYLSNGEKIAANSVTDWLNLRTEQAVAAAPENFTFIDPTALGSPFHGHELCTDDPYFIGPAISGSFHPNVYGQEAYAMLVEANL